jgi:hypothetical protein
MVRPIITAPLTPRIGVGLQVVRYSERPQLWAARDSLPDKVWPEYNRHGATLYHYWGRLYEVLPDWQFVLYDPGA